MGIRKNFSNLTDEERELFVQALYHLKSTGLVDEFAEMHASHLGMAYTRVLIFCHGIANFFFGSNRPCKHIIQPLRFRTGTRQLIRVPLIRYGTMDFLGNSTRLGTFNARSARQYCPRPTGNHKSKPCNLSKLLAGTGASHSQRATSVGCRRNGQYRFTR